MQDIKKPINMTEVREGANQQEHYTMITEEIDKYADMDKDFILWYLLGRYRNYVSRELDEQDYPVEGVKEYALRRMMLDHLKWAEDIKNVLAEVIF